MALDQELTPRAEKAFSFAQETAKQQITLSTAVMALTLTFLKDSAEKGTPRTLLELSWVLFLVSIAAGVATLMSLAGNLERPNDAVDSIYNRNITVFAVVQAVAFLVALILTTWFGICAT